jgi:hypothetical protein
MSGEEVILLGGKIQIGYPSHDIPILLVWEIGIFSVM